MLINPTECLHTKQVPFEYSYIEIIEGVKTRITKREMVCLNCKRTISSSVTRNVITKGTGSEESI